MKEDFLHYVWRYQYFDKEELLTTEGETVEVMHPGHPHINAGPDFVHARLKIGGIAWAGQVEIHVKSSDWLKHRHQNDPAYDSVVLHVVWEEDQEIFRQDGTGIPCIKLSNRISNQLRLRYEYLQEIPFEQGLLPCSHWLVDMPPLVKISTLDRALFQRLEQRASEWLLLLSLRNGDWEQVAYEQLCRYLGGPVNRDAFGHLSQLIPWKRLKRRHSKPSSVEALIFGYAGFLSANASDDYQQLLRKVFLWETRESSGSFLPPQWKWLRMRPSSFPTVRLAQLGALAREHPHLSAVVHLQSLEELQQWLAVSRDEYWIRHYDFGKPYQKPRGKWSIDSLLINWAIPLLYAYGKHKGNEEPQERAISFLQSLKAESNSLLKPYLKAGFPLESVGDTQAALELWKSSCKPKKCLSCPIGIKALAFERK